MGNNEPGQGGIPGWGQPQEPQQAPQPQPGWGQQPSPQAQQPQPQGWGAPPPQAPQQTPQPQPGWGAPPPQAPQQQPGWGQQPPPPQQQGWGTPPPQQQQQPAWGAPPPAGWNPAPPQKQGNGCLKGCLIVGGILLVLAILAVIGLTVFGLKFAGDMGIGANGEIKECPYVSNADLAKVLGSDATAIPISGIADATLGLALDKRVIKDADNCMLTVGSGASTDTGGFGRIAKYSGGDASSKFSAEKKAADAGAYLGDDVSGLGDQAFCTTASETYPGLGVLVRKGNDLVYVSMLDAAPIASDGSLATSCAVAQQLAKLVIK